MPRLLSILSIAYLALGVDVPDIRRDTRCTLDIVERELAHSRVELEEEGQRLANTTAGTENGDFGSLCCFVVSGDCFFDFNGWWMLLTLAAVAEKALRWAAAAPKTERVA